MESAVLRELGMRHLLVATAMVVAGLVITFGTASVLQNVAAAKRDTVYIPDPVVAEQNKSPAVVKQRNGEQARQVILASRRAS